MGTVLFAFACDQGFMPGKRLPSAIVVNEDVSESHLSYGLSRRVGDFVEATHVGEISVEMGFQIFQVILAGVSVGNASQRVGTVVELAVHVDVLKLLGQDAAHGGGIVLFQGLCP
jgi:hypothetical protein